MSLQKNPWTLSNTIVGGKKFNTWTATTVSTVTGDRAFRSYITPSELDLSKPALFIFNSEAVAVGSGTSVSGIYYCWSRTASITDGTSFSTPVNCVASAITPGDADAAAVFYAWNPLTASNIPCPGLFLTHLAGSDTGGAKTFTFKIIQAA